MTECTECAYFVRCNNNNFCLMKHDYQIVNGSTIFPKNCEDYNGGDGE